MWTMGVAPAITWCKEVWRREDHLAPLRLAWQHAKKVMPTAKRVWCHAVGPATATWATLQRLGWKFAGPTAFVDAGGERIDLTAVSPLKVKERLVRAARQWTMKQGLRTAGFEKAAAEVSRLDWDWVRKVLHGKHGGTAGERGGFRATLDGSAWTESRLWKAGYRADQVCACGHEAGNTPHRMLRCPLHIEDRVGFPGGLKRKMEGYLGDDILGARGHRLFPVMRAALPQGLTEEDTLVQEIRWGKVTRQLTRKSMGGQRKELWRRRS